MAIISGVTGTVSLPTGYTQGTNLYAFAWRLNMTRDALETTSWANSANAREYIGGLATGTGSADVFFDDAAGVTAHDFTTENLAAASFTLTATSGSTYAFNGLVTGFNVESSKAGLWQGSIDFQVSGDVTIAET